MLFARWLPVLPALIIVSALEYSLNVTNTSPYQLAITDSNDHTIVSNSAILAGRSNDTVSAIQENAHDASVKAELVSPTVARIQVNSSLGFTGASFSAESDASHYGVWGYPWNSSLSNTGISFDLKGLQGNPGINYLSARSPFFISSTGYAVYADTMSMGSYQFDDSEHRVTFIFNTTQLEYYIILPSHPADFKSLLKQYTGLSDTTPLWSPGSYGLMVWHNDFQRESGFPDGVENSQQFVEDVKEKLFEHRIRASTIMADRPYGTGEEGWGNFDFDETFWSNITELTESLGSSGIDFEIWVANRAVPDSQLHDKGSAGNWLFTDMVTEEDPSIALNLSIPEAYNYMKDRMSYFTDIGVKGYKIDRGDEDEMPAWEQNIQSFLYHRLLFENQAAKWGRPDGKPAGFYNFARSVNDRSRKYTGVWGADPESTYKGLEYSLKTGIRSGLLGFPMWGSDCGGYTREVGELSPTKELWARWMWFSAFSPVYEMMLYEGSIPWYDYSEDLVTVLKDTSNLHHELIPFIQSYMASATSDGLPIIRAAFLEEPDDKRSCDIDDAYFFGSEFFIAPIIKDSRERSVYLPGDTKYLEYFEKTKVFKGGEEIVVERNLDSVPAFVREGAIIPRGDVFRFNALWEEDWKARLSVEVYPSFGIEKGTFNYYDHISGKLIDTWAVTDKESGQVCVSYGFLGTDGELLVYLAQGPRSFKLHPQGKTHCLDRVQTLFD